MSCDADAVTKQLWAEKILDARRLGGQAGRAAARAVVEEAVGQGIASESALYRWAAAYQQKGSTGLQQPVRRDKGHRRAISPVWQKDWLSWARSADRLHLPVTERIRGFRDHCAARGVEVDCSDRTLMRIVEEAHPGHAQTKRERARAYKRQMRMTAAYANHIWMWDQHTADFMCQHPQTGRPFRPILVHCVDVRSGLFVGGRYGVSYNTDLVEAALLDAILPDPETARPWCGTPQHMYGDNGKQFTSDWCRGALDSLRVELHTGQPAEPTGHGRMEQSHRMVQQVCEMVCPAYVGSDGHRANAPIGLRMVDDGERAAPDLLTLDEANRRLWAAMLVINHRPYLDGPSRLERWMTSIVDHPERRAVPRIEDLAWRWMRKATGGRTVAGGMIRFNQVRYTGPFLGEWNGEEVEVRYLPSDVRRIWVVADGRVICEARVAEQYEMFSETSQAEHQVRLREGKRVRERFDEASRILGLRGDDASRQAAQHLQVVREELHPLQAAALLDQVRAESDPGVVRLPMPAPGTLELTDDRVARAGGGAAAWLPDTADEPAKQPGPRPNDFL